jgi:hypothetical protein
VFYQVDGRPWKPDHVSRRFKKLAALTGVLVSCLHEGGRYTGNSLMQDAGVDQELRMREVGHADKSVNSRYTHPLKRAHPDVPILSHQRPQQRSRSRPERVPPLVKHGGAGGARTHDRQIMSPLL